MSELLMVNEAARLIGVAPSTVHHYERTGKLRVQKTSGGVRLFDRSDVEKFREEREARRSSQTAAVVGVPA